MFIYHVYYFQHVEDFTQTLVI